MIYVVKIISVDVHRQQVWKWFAYKSPIKSNTHVFQHNLGHFWGESEEHKNILDCVKSLKDADIDLKDIYIEGLVLADPKDSSIR